MTKQLVAAIQEGYRGIYTVDIKEDVEKMVQSLKDVIDCIKLQPGKSFPAKELQVLVATEGKERELVAYMLTLCFHKKSEDILRIK